MASSKKSLSPSDLVSVVAQILNRTVRSSRKLTLGLSGGVDSVVLLDVLVRLRASIGFQLSAVHINHQISPNAAAWAAFCQDLCRAHDVPLEIAPVTLQDRQSLGLEAAAREARYRVFRRQQTDFMALAHHLDDQAETVLLQLLRGAGANGLSGMPELSDPHSAISMQVLRPLLEVQRTEIERYAHERGLQWIEDESNLQVAYDRNFLRHLVFPVVEERFPAYRNTFYRVSRNLAEAAELMDELAQADARESVGDGKLDIASLKALSAARAKNLLRYWLAENGAPIPSADRLEEMLRQLLEAKVDSNVRVRLGEFEVRRFQGKACVLLSQATPPSGFCMKWNGEHEWVLQALGATLIFESSTGQGISRAKLEQAPVTIRLRQGGEALRPDCARPRRSLKNLLQEAHVPPWTRTSLPLLFCGEHLVWVPGVGVDCDFQAEHGEPSLRVH